jgi:hemerythrin-like domain-containing protein
MITYEELHKQNHAITEISNVFLYLIENRSMCDTDITCELFFDYVNKVKDHLELQDNHIYTAILRDGDADSILIAENFMSGSREIKRIFHDYQRKWSNPKGRHLRISNYSKFNKETNKMFELVLKRIQDETEKLYPLIRSISGDDDKVASQSITYIYYLTPYRGNFYKIPDALKIAYSR